MFPLFVTCVESLIKPSVPQTQTCLFHLLLTIVSVLFCFLSWLKQKPSIRPFFVDLRFSVLTSEANLVTKLGSWFESLQIKEYGVGLEKSVFRHDLRSRLWI